MQEDIADKVVHMLAGRWPNLRRRPGLLATDVGPVIDADASALLKDEHAAKMAATAKPIAEAKLGAGAEHGTFFAPRVGTGSRSRNSPRELGPACTSSVGRPTNWTR